MRKIEPVSRRQFLHQAGKLAAALALAPVARAAPAVRRPNILLAIADDASYAHFGANGCTFVKTPVFDRLAREGVLFRNAFTPLPKCSPSRAALLTGRYPWQLAEAGVHNGLFPSRFKVYPDLLEAAGYVVGYTGKGWNPGDWKAGGFTRNPAGPEFNARKLNPPTGRISNNDYAANFEDFLAKRPADRPFCFWYGGHEPHRAYEAGSGVRAQKKLQDAVVPPYFPDRDAVRSDLLDYALEIEWFDRQLGRIIRKLEDIGELDNTLILVTSDNGMPFPRVKGHMFEDACHMPMVIRWGAAKGGRVVEDFVSFVDFAPTFLEAAGLAPHAQMSGRSLMNLLRADAAGQVDPARDHVILGRERTDLGRPDDVGYPVRVLRTKDFWYSRNFEPDRWPSGNPETNYMDVDDSPTKRLVVQGEKTAEGRKYFDLAFGKRPAEELYDLRKDPACVNNVAADPQNAAVKSRLWAQLEGELRRHQDPRIVGDGSVFDRYPYVGGRNNAWDRRANRRK